MGVGIRLTLTVVGLVSMTTAVAADILYSINETTDELVTVDSSTGTLTVVGPIGHNMYNPSLTYLDGVIYALSNKRWDYVELVAINPVTGAKMSSVSVDWEGVPITNAEGLTTLQGQLLIGFWDGEGNQYYSDSLGGLSSGGEISSVVDFSDSGADFDELTVDATSRIFSTDGEAAFIRIYAATLSPPSYTLLCEPLWAENLCIEFGPSGLFAIAYPQLEICRIDPNTGELLDTAPLEPNVSITGLAYVPPLHALTLSETNGSWGSVSTSPERDPNYPMAFDAGSQVTLTATPIEGKALNHWKIYDPNFPGDSNYAVLDSNLSTTILMMADREVTAVFKCGSSMEPLLPMIVSVLGMLVCMRRKP